jgi:hypothetical protein
MAAQDATAPCFGVKNQSNGCYAVFTATKIPAVFADGAGADKIFFDLQSTTALKGYSSNACWNQRCSDLRDTGPDFQFVQGDQTAAGLNAPTNQGQRIGTTGTPSTLTVVVTSFDYGGETVVRPLVTDDPDNPAYLIEADFVDQQGKRLKKSAITLPLDQDSNGIADAWEKPYANRLGLGDYFPSPGIDNR